MADNFYYTDPETGLLLFRSVERTIGEASVHNQVVEVNVGAATEALWDGEVSLEGAQMSSITGAIGSAAAAAGEALTDTELRAADVKVTLDSEAVVLGAGTAEIGKLAAGTAAIGKLAANSGVDIGDVDVTSMPDAVCTGKAAIDAAASGNPVLISGKAFAPGQATSDVSADGDVVALQLTRSGRLYIEETHPNDWQSPYEFATAQTNYSLKAAPGAGLRLVITDIYLSSAVANDVKLLDGSGGTVLWRQPGVAANGGSTAQFKGRLKLTADTALCLTSTGTGNAFILVLGYICAG